MRAITADELVLLRKSGQFSRLYLAGLTTPPIVMAARVNEVFTDNDRVASVTFDTVTTGAYTDVIEGMTLWIGTAAGLRDIGEVRVRSISSTVIGVGETSDISWSDNAYLTVRNEFLLWPKHVRISGNQPYMDYGIEYTDQHLTFDPVPIMGNDVVIDLSDLDIELVKNGTFDNNTTTNWTAGTNAVLYNVSQTMRVDRNGGGLVDHAYQDIYTKIGTTYSFSINMIAYTNGYEVYVDGVKKFDTANGTGIKSTTFVATATTTRIALRAIDSVDAELSVDDISSKATEIVIAFPECVDSHVFDSTISAYSFSSTAGTWVNPTTSGAKLKISAYPTGGLIRVKLEVTSAAGASFSGYRYIYVYNAAARPFTDFTVGDISGDYEGGGWSFDVTIHGDASTIRDRAKVILFAEDYYGDNKISLGQVEGRENIICTGYVDSESVEILADSSSVKFTVKPASFWLDKMAGFPPGVEMKGTPTEWTQIKGLTVDRAVWHLLHWRSTTTQVMDVRLSGDTRYAAGFVVPTQSIWGQVKEIASTSIFAIPGTNRNGQFFLEVDAQLVPEVDRSWGIVMTIQKQDWRDRITMLCNCDVTEVAMMASSGVNVNASGKGTPYFSLAPGHIFKHYGAPEIVDRLLLSSQAQSNELAGLLAGLKNNKYPSFDVSFASNNRLIDIFPRSYLNIHIEIADTVRGREYDGNIIPRSLSLEFSDGVLLMSGNFEGESFPELNVNGDPPIDTTECGETDCPKGYELNAKGCCERIINGGCKQTSCPTGYHLNEKGCCVIDIDTGGGGETGGASTVALLCVPGITQVGQAAGLVYTTNFDAYNPEDVVWVNYIEGLTYDQAKNANDLFITPDGHVYLVSTGGVLSTDSYIAVAESLGSPFTILVDEAWLTAEFGAEGVYSLRVDAFGINPNAPNEYAFIAGISKWPGTAGVYKFYDNSLTGSAITAPAKNNFGYGTIEYQDGWITSIGRSDGGLGDPSTTYLFKNNYENPTDTLVAYVSGSAGLWVLKNGQLLWKNSSGGTKTYITTGTEIGVWWDFNVITRTYVGTSPSGGLASSPTGLVMMAVGTPTGLTQGFWISFTGGTTWKLMPGGIPDKDHVIANGHSDQIWIASKILTGVYYSKDAGQTWENRSNQTMADLLWLSNVYKIIVVKNEANP